jgi:hypothetical protein
MAAMSKTAPVGLYSISVRGLDVPELLSWASHSGIPFIHLRGGPRGFDLAARDQADLRRWRRISDARVPITGVTTDTDLADLLADDPEARRQAHVQVTQLAEAAQILGARWLRLLARHPLTRIPAMVAAVSLTRYAVPLLVELHHPGWLQHEPRAVLDALVRWPRVRLLADTAQLANAFTTTDGEARSMLAWTLEHAEVLHLSDAGPGLDASRHTDVADAAAARIAAGHRIEVAVEWTGADRTTAACLARYRAHSTWWATRLARAGTLA